MPNAQKTERVTALKERIEGSDALLLAEYRGLSVHDATELRRSLSDQARFSVVKNTLFQRAAGAAGIEELGPLLSGPTAVAFVSGDVVSVAKKVVDAAKKYPALVIKGAYMDGQVLDAAAAQALATLESREVMLSKIAGMLKSEMSRAASMFQALQSQFVGLLEAYRDTFPAEPTAGSAAPETDVATVVEESMSPEPESVLAPEAAAPSEVAVAEPDGGSSTDETEPSTDDTGADSRGGIAAADEDSATDETMNEEG
jgi:large subunit ribosomal protein L10